MRTRLGLGLVCAGLLSLPGACSAPAQRADPAVAGPSSAPVSSRDLAVRFAVYQDDYLRNYVDAVGRRLLSVAPRTDRLPSFAILDCGAPMLLATGDDRVYLSRGLLALLQSEDELAGLLAHVLAHLLAGQPDRHDPAAARPLPWLRGGPLGRQVDADLRQAAGLTPAEAARLPLLSFGASAEQTVDDLAMRRAAAAGYDPEALAGLLHRVRRVGTLDAVWRNAGFLARHGFSPQRLAALQTAAAALSWQRARPFAGSREALLKRLDGLYWGTGNPQQGVFLGARFLQPDMGISLDFPAGWTLVNTPRFVAAIQPDGEAVMQLSTVEATGDPARQAADFAQRLQQDAGSLPTQDRAFSAGPWPGRLLRVDDRDSLPPLTACYAWVQSAGATFRLLGAGQARHADGFCVAMQSLRPLSAAARQDIKTSRIRLVEAMDGESFAALGERSGNLWSAALTAAINDLAEDAALSAGDRIRILHAEPYY